MEIEAAQLPRTLPDVVMASSTETSRWERGSARRRSRCFSTRRREAGKTYTTTSWCAPRRRGAQVGILRETLCSQKVYVYSWGTTPTRAASSGVTGGITQRSKRKGPGARRGPFLRPADLDPVAMAAMNSAEETAFFSPVARAKRSCVITPDSRVTMSPLKPLREFRSGPLKSARRFFSAPLQAKMVARVGGGGLPLQVA